MKSINNARATEQGIIFYSLQMPLACFTYFNQNGEIQSDIFPTILDDDFEVSRQFVPKFWQILLFDVILICICAFIFRNPTFTIAAIYFSITASFYFFNLISSSLSIHFNKNLAKFHSAEHMAINAYEKLQRIPTLAEIKNFSRFSKQCGSFKLIQKSVLFTLISILLCFSSQNFILYVFLMFIVVFLIFYDKVNSWLKYFEILFTSKPTDKELELAITALENFEEMEDCISDAYTAYGSLISNTNCDTHL